MRGKGIFWAVGGTLIGLVIGVPVLAAIFADNGPFAGLVLIPTTGALGAANPYSAILTAIIALIPLLVVAFFAFKFFGERVKGMGRGITKRRRARRQRSRGRSRRSRGRGRAMGRSAGVNGNVRIPARRLTDSEMRSIMRRMQYEQESRARKGMRPYEG